MNHLIRTGAVLLLALLVSGCETAREYSLTYKLWDKGARPTCHPAPDPKLALFISETEPDVLATYDALSERGDRISRRAYFVRTNEARIATRRRPFYFEPDLATNWHAVPIVTSSNAVPALGRSAQYPVRTDSGTGFELFRDGRSEGTHDLPVYGEGLNPAARVAMTPLAVTGDTIMVGLVTSALAAVLWVESGCPPFGGSH